ncbi:MAG: hypothetical protein ACE5SW_10545 [Nitrososphaeraceae archaeon]
MHIDYKKTILIILVSIIVIGIIAIPLGNPKFIYRAVGLELAFIFISLALLRGYIKVLYICVPIALIVIIANTLAPQHVDIMLTFSKPLNAVVLIVGGYILQTLLIFFSINYLYKIHSKSLLKKQ